MVDAVVATWLAANATDAIAVAAAEVAPTSRRAAPSMSQPSGELATALLSVFRIVETSGRTKASSADTGAAVVAALTEVAWVVASTDAVAVAVVTFCGADAATGACTTAEGSAGAAFGRLAIAAVGVGWAGLSVAVLLASFLVDDFFGFGLVGFGFGVSVVPAAGSADFAFFFGFGVLLGLSCEVVPEVEVESVSGAAQAIAAGVATADPIPSATARAPTRPTYLPLFMLIAL